MEDHHIMPPLSSTSSSFEFKRFARCPPGYLHSDISQRLHIPMSSLRSSSPPIHVKAPLLHAPAPSSVAPVVPLQPTTAASITPAVYYSRLSFGTRALLPDFPTHGPFTVFGLPSLFYPIIFSIDNLSRPDNCDGTYEANCDPAREYTNIRQIISDAGATDLLSYMNAYWKDYQGDDESFWSHEWGKHGTCISTLETSCYTNYVPKEEVVAYFQKAVDLFKALPSYQVRQMPCWCWESFSNCPPNSSYRLLGLSLLILPHTLLPQSILLFELPEESTLSFNVRTELWMRFGIFTMSREVYNLVPFSPRIRVCTHITYHLKHSVYWQSVSIVGTTSSCPSAGIKYLPKGTSPGGGGGGGGGVPSGKGTLPITSGGVQKGCIISGGTWYTSGTCASFTATPSGTVSQNPYLAAGMCSFFL